MKSISVENSKIWKEETSFCRTQLWRKLPARRVRIKTRARIPIQDPFLQIEQNMDQQFQQMQQQFNQMDEQIDQRVQQMDRQFQQMDKQFQQMSEDVQSNTQITKEQIGDMARKTVSKYRTNHSHSYQSYQHVTIMRSGFHPTHRTVVPESHINAIPIILIIFYGAFMYLISKLYKFTKYYDYERLKLTLLSPILFIFNSNFRNEVNRASKLQQEQAKLEAQKKKDQSQENF